MKSIFQSATVKLTAWYLLILMSIGLLFSIIIFALSSGELQNRIGAFESRMERIPAASGAITYDFNELRDRQIHESEVNLFFALIYLNLSILVLGGIGSYVLARKSLQPIEQSHEAQSRFTSDASHELRTPLAVMKSELEVALRSKQLSKQDMQELLESNLEEVNRLSELSETLLQISKHDQSRIDKESVSLTSIVKKVTTVHSVDQKRLRLRLPPKDKIMITANEASIKELLMILLDNALRYSPPESIVTVEVASENQAAHLILANAGTGIHPDDMPHIFERFYRSDKSRTGGQKVGYGLGLSLAKKIADIHNAVIQISSEPNELTIVKVTFKK